MSISHIEQRIAVALIVGSIWFSGGYTEKVIGKASDNIINTLVGRYRP